MNGIRYSINLPQSEITSLATAVETKTDLPVFETKPQPGQEMTFEDLDAQV